MTRAGRNAIVDRWLREVATPAMARFLRAPLAAIVDGVIDDDFAAARAAVDQAVHLIAVQAPTASEAGSFLLSLKSILLERDRTDAADALGERVERLMLVAVDSYVACRLRLGEITSKERARRTWLLDRLGASATSTARRS